MTNHPILFQPNMIEALHAGRKTQTRRILKPNQHGAFKVFYPGSVCLGAVNSPEQELIDPKMSLSRYYPGDRLWVREAWRIGAWHYNNADIAVDYRTGPRKEWLHCEDPDMLHRLIDQSREDAAKAKVRLSDTYWEHTWHPGEGPCRWRPSIHMPKWVSRTVLTVTEVRVQRLQDISEADAIAEGVEVVKSRNVSGIGSDFYRNYEGASVGFYNAKLSFQTLINSINGPDTWAANPWVTATSFEVVKGNISEV